MKFRYLLNFEWEDGKWNSWLKIKKKEEKNWCQSLDVKTVFPSPKCIAFKLTYVQKRQGLKKWQNKNNGLKSIDKLDNNFVFIDFRANLNFKSKNEITYNSKKLNGKMNYCDRSLYTLIWFRNIWSPTKTGVRLRHFILLQTIRSFFNAFEYLYKKKIKFTWPSNCASLLRASQK